jgi:hypothetical protein
MLYNANVNVQNSKNRAAFKRINQLHTFGMDVSTLWKFYLYVFCRYMGKYCVSSYQYLDQ